MGFAEFFELSIGLQVSLGSGYLAYVTAYSGLRKHHGTDDTVFITLVFSAISLITFQLTAPFGELNAAASAFAASHTAGILWRICGRRVWQWLMAKTGVHREDGVFAPWDSVMQSGRKVGQISVHTKDGRVLYLNDRRNFSASPWQGLYLGSDGGIVLAVEEEEMPDGTTEQRTGVYDAEWGTRLTYIPAAEVSRVNIRLK